MPDSKGELKRYRKRSAEEYPNTRHFDSPEYVEWLESSLFAAEQRIEELEKLEKCLRTEIEVHEKHFKVETERVCDLTVSLSTAEQKIVGLKAELAMELDYAGDCREKLDDEKEKVRDLRKELSTAEQRIEELEKAKKSLGQQIEDMADDVRANEVQIALLRGKLAIEKSALSKAEATIAEMRKRIDNLELWYGESLIESYELDANLTALRAEREKLAGDAFRAGAVWNGRWHSAGIGSQHFPESEVDAIAAFLAQKEGK